mmetsp:Transcript_18083/g.32207  ORF Transcript_18083/g.32207 Transcript_18083/m.32207 type:complete len:382 (-) Transcript_18083:60-1205(-)
MYDPSHFGLQSPKLAHAQPPQRRLRPPLPHDDALHSGVAAVAAHSGTQGRSHCNAGRHRLLQPHSHARLAAGGCGGDLRHGGWDGRRAGAPRPARPLCGSDIRVVLRLLHLLRHLPHDRRPPRQRVHHQRDDGGGGGGGVPGVLAAGGPHRTALDHRGRLPPRRHLPHPLRHHRRPRAPVAGSRRQVRRRRRLCAHPPLRRRALPHRRAQRLHRRLLPGRAPWRHGHPRHHHDRASDALPAAGLPGVGHLQHRRRPPPPHAARDAGRGAAGDAERRRRAAARAGAQALAPRVGGGDGGGRGAAHLLALLLCGLHARPRLYAREGGRAAVKVVFQPVSCRSVFRSGGCKLCALDSLVSSFLCGWLGAYQAAQVLEVFFRSLG